MQFSNLLLTLSALSASPILAAPTSEVGKLAKREGANALYSYISSDAELASPEEKRKRESASALYSYISSDAELASPEEKRKRESASALYSYISSDAELASPEE